MARLLAGASYDPGTAVTYATTANQAMTALDTTNLRLTFTAPLNGTVRVMQRFITSGATTVPAILSGVLDGATVKGRVAPTQLSRPVSATTNALVQQAEFCVSGLTAGTTYTWDAALGIETAVASSAIKVGGPNDATVNNAWGSYSYEIYDTPGLLATALYDPGSSVAKSIASGLAMTAFDTTNLRLTFTAPASGNVFVVVSAPQHGAASVLYNVMFGALDGATVKCRQKNIGSTSNNTAAATDIVGQYARMLVTGLTPGTSYTWDAAYGVETNAASANIAYGGADDNTADNAFGGVRYEVWDASQALPAIGGVI